MEQVYVIIKIAVEKDGPHVLATTEKAFKDQKQAMDYLKNVPIIWQEAIGGIECECERAVHPIVLE